MRIAIIAPGSRGDVEPYVALGKGLLEAGHAVRLVTHENFETLISPHGIEFWPVEGSVQEIVQGAGMREHLEGGSFLAVLSEMSREAQRGALNLARAGLAAGQGMDLLVAGLGGLFVGLALAEKLRLCLLQAYYIPFTPTRAFPSFLVPGLRSGLGGALNRLSYDLARQMMWQAFQPADRLARREVLDRRPAPRTGPYHSDCLRDMPVLYGFSPAVIPPPPDWGNDVHVTGYWFLDPAEDWRPPADLSEFLEAGPPPVYIGFGSMSSRDPQEAGRLVLEALARAGQRAVILSGWSGLQPADLPNSAIAVDSIPFSWLFPRCAAVVHHGGAGTTAAGLRAGVPSVVIPFFADQPFWGRRVAELGVGPAPIPRKKLTVEKLARAIETAVGDPGMRRRAADLGAKIRAENGIAGAVAIVAGLPKSPRRC
jgi:UDP:flavonoid glycosyltransferase YjiC (YdhE family)